MPVVAIFQGPEVTEKLYEEVCRQISGGKFPLESASDWPVEGLLLHVSGQGPSGFRVVDVWESEEAFGKFGEKIGPVLGGLGVDIQPEVYPAHTVVTP